MTFLDDDPRDGWNKPAMTGDPMTPPNPLKNHEMICPYCGEIATCEMVDIGVGVTQCSPFACEHCGWVQREPGTLILRGDDDGF